MCVHVRACACLLFLENIAPQGNAQLIHKQIDKDNLSKYLRAFVANQTIELSTFTYTTLCIQHNIVCFLYLQGCPDTAAAASSSPSQRLKAFRLLAEQSIEHWPQIAEKYEPKWFQFAFVNVAKNPEMSTFCRQNETNEVIMAVFDGGLQMTIYDTPLSEAGDFDSFWTFVNEVFEHDYSTPVFSFFFKTTNPIYKNNTLKKVIDAPNIRPPPVQNPTIIDDFKEYIEDFDWKSEDFLLNVAIVGCMIIGVILLKQVGCAGFVMFIFALSIFGGGFHAFFGMGDGEIKSSRSRRKGK
ncbi:hypothetical protein RFI_13591 [Reticulomyxa filosa]|uniref:Uncharacterized protein n=1 Tax=Reticulomyxa filosa TaxID=46433 RepID=X6NE14_RETFI|nr:hypothetical protein RFI_13591 [Reticulomyxa filosa]|eukprot:ETO23587.1 hypothetical protein RFI_13591 [Reticulomyxa filosa]